MGRLTFLVAVLALLVSVANFVRTPANAATDIVDPLVFDTLNAKARILTCDDFPEIIISVNRRNTRHCADPLAVENPAYATGSFQIRMRGDEEDIILYLAEGRVPQDPLRVFRMNRFGACLTDFQPTWNPRCADKDMQGLSVFDLRGNGGIRSHYFDARPTHYPTNALVIRKPSPAPTAFDDPAWMFRLQDGNAPYALVLRNATGLPVLKFEQDGSVWVRDGNGWRRL